MAVSVANSLRSESRASNLIELATEGAYRREPQKVCKGCVPDIADTLSRYFARRKKLTRTNPLFLFYSGFPVQTAARKQQQQQYRSFERSLGRLHRQG